MCKYNYSGAVNPNILHSPSACSMFKEIAQYLKLFVFFLDTISFMIMTSTSQPWYHCQNFAQYFQGVDLNSGYAPGPSHRILLKTQIEHTSLYWYAYFMKLRMFFYFDAKFQVSGMGENFFTCISTKDKIGPSKTVLMERKMSKFNLAGSVFSA